jgi:hypothetical protein
VTDRWMSIFFSKNIIIHNKSGADQPAVSRLLLVFPGLFQSHEFHAKYPPPAKILPATSHDHNLI